MCVCVCVCVCINVTQDCLYVCNMSAWTMFQLESIKSTYYTYILAWNLGLGSLLTSITPQTLDVSDIYTDVINNSRLGINWNPIHAWMYYVHTYVLVVLYRIWEFKNAPYRTNYLEMLLAWQPTGLYVYNMFHFITIIIVIWHRK